MVNEQPRPLASVPALNARFQVRLDDGRWSIADTATPACHLLPGVTFADKQRAEELADRYNAIHEGEPNRVVEQLRDDFHREERA